MWRLWAAGALLASLGLSYCDRAKVHHKVWMNTYSDADYVGAKVSFRANFRGSHYQHYQASFDPKQGEHTVLLHEEIFRINGDNQSSAKERAEKKSSEVTLSCVQDAWEVKVEGPEGVFVCCNPYTFTFAFVKDTCPEDFLPFVF